MEDGVSYLIYAARQTIANLYLIAEEGPENLHMVADTELNAAWHIRFNYMVKVLLREGQYFDWDWNNGDQWLAVSDQGYARPHEMVNFFESHDEERDGRSSQSAGPRRGGGMP